LTEHKTAFNVPKRTLKACVRSRLEKGRLGTDLLASYENADETVQGKILVQEYV